MTIKLYSPCAPSHPETPLFTQEARSLTQSADPMPTKPVSTNRSQQDDRVTDVRCLELNETGLSCLFLLFQRYIKVQSRLATDLRPLFGVPDFSAAQTQGFVELPLTHPRPLPPNTKLYEIPTAWYPSPPTAIPSWPAALTPKWAPTTFTATFSPAIQVKEACLGPV